MNFNQTDQPNATQKGAAASKSSCVDWQTSDELVDYPKALEAMAARVKALQGGKEPPLVWLLQHPPLYTLGPSASSQDVLAPERCPVYHTGRGGQVTYHGPGQRVAYVCLDLKRLQDPPDLRAYVFKLEQWLIDTLADFGLRAERRKGRRGLWVRHNGRESKIASVGVRVQKWITSHGVALNINPDLSYFDGIVPCGLKGLGVTSMHALGVEASLADVDEGLRRHFGRVVPESQRFSNACDFQSHALENQRSR